MNLSKGCTLYGIFYGLYGITTGKEQGGGALGNQLLLILHSLPTVIPLDTCHDPEK